MFFKFHLLQVSKKLLTFRSFSLIQLSLFFLFAFFFTQITPKSQAASTITLHPLSDAVVYSGTPSTNYGANDIIEVGNSTLNGYKRSSFLKFDISGIPQGATLTDVWLTIYLIDCNGVPTTLGIKQVSQDWRESEVTWSNAPETLTSPIKTTVVSCESYQAWNFDAKEIVQNWYSGQDNYGFLLYSKSVDSFLRTFYSREYGGLEKQPSLAISYTLPEPPVEEEPDTTFAPTEQVPDTTPPSSDSGDNTPPDTTTPEDISVADLLPDDITIPEDEDEDWKSLPLFSPMTETFGMTAFYCLICLCCCFVVLLLLLIIFLLIKKGKTKEHNVKVEAEHSADVSSGHEEVQPKEL